MQICGNCKFYVAKPLNGKGVGECRFLPPKAFPVQQAGGVGIITVVPPVNAGDFCSKFAMREGALNG